MTIDDLDAIDPCRQSGFGGGMQWWERERGVITDAIDRDGSFLDACCANGLLLGTVVRRARTRVEPYGLDISPGLAELARQRVDGVYVGNALTWEPPRRFDFVYTLLEIVPAPRRREFVARLLRDVVADGGRLIVGNYGSNTAQREAARAPTAW